MSIVAATRAGGSNNQDRYTIGRDFVVLLDGATSVAGDRSHDPGWFAEQLATAIAAELTGSSTIPDAVANGIATTRDAYGLTTETSPTSTVAVARWSRGELETYVLGDSPVIVLRADGTEVVHEDHRLAHVAAAERAAYRDSLAAGRGYDATHRATLVELQAEQARRRNQHGGYWIAGTDPAAGHHGILHTTALDDIKAVMLASDGVARDRHSTAARWRDLYAEAIEHGPDHVLRDIHDAETSDSDGRRWPRAKRHDDKTLVVVPFDKE